MQCGFGEYDLSVLRKTYYVDLGAVSEAVHSEPLEAPDILLNEGAWKDSRKSISASIASNTLDAAITVTLGFHNWVGPQKKLDVTSSWTFVAIGAARAPKPEVASVEIFRDGLPERAFERVSRLDVHMEKTFLLSSDLDDALSELKKQARASGADAIIEIHERRSTVIETKIYHVTAYGIRFID